jgi:hypothetical protein
MEFLVYVTVYSDSYVSDVEVTACHFGYIDADSALSWCKILVANGHVVCPPICNPSLPGNLESCI